MGLAFAWSLAQLGGCAFAPPPPVPPQAPLLADSAYGEPPAKFDPATLFALTPAMEQYLRQEVTPQLRSRGSQNGLVDALYDNARLRLHYDNAYTRTAAEAFEGRSGNCLSLVIMTAAFAKKAGVPLRYQAIPVPPTWGRSGTLVLAYGHVNLALGRSGHGAHLSADPGDWLTVDFVRPPQGYARSALVIEEPTIVAMYLNNRAAETLAKGEIEGAYWWARTALDHDPRLATPYNTLGVIHQRRGLREPAEAAFRAALALDGEEVNALANLAQLLKDQGRQDEANPLLARLERLQPDPPFKFHQEGLQALAQGRPRDARRLFEREIARDPDNPEFHHALARSLLALGDLTGAQRALTAALERSGSREQQARYSGKLAALREHEAVVH